MMPIRPPTAGGMLLVSLLVMAAPVCAGAQPTWKLSGPPALTLLLDRAAPVHATVYGKAVTNPRVVHSTLRETATGALLGTQWLRLCDNPADGCTQMPSLTPGSHPLFLVVSREFHGKGEFKGTVYVQVDEQPDPSALDLAVYGSSYWAWGFGCAAIFAGVLLSLVSTVFLRQSSLRLDALAPAALLGSEIDKIETLIEQGKADLDLEFTFPDIGKHLNDLKRELSENYLELKNFIPRRLGNPLGGEVETEKYRAHLAAKEDEIAALAVIARQGMPPLVAAWKAHPKHQAVASARDALDKLGGTAIKADAAPDAVARILAAMEAGLLPPGVAAAPQAGGPPVPLVRSAVEIRAMQSRLALVAWSTWAVITVIAGAAAIVVSNNGFGVPLDYFKCFFWGLGLQAAGQQLQQLTPQGVATSFKLSKVAG